MDVHKQEIFKPSSAQNTYPKNSVTIANWQDFELIIGKPIKKIIPDDDLINLGANILFAIEEGYFPTNRLIVLDRLIFPCLKPGHYVEIPPNVILKFCKLKEGVIGFYKGWLSILGERAMAIALYEAGASSTNWPKSQSNKGIWDESTLSNQELEEHCKEGRKVANQLSVDFWISLKKGG